MNASKLSIARLPVRGSTRSSGSLTRSHSRSRACEIPPSGSSGKHVVGDPHLVRVGVARKGQQRRDLRLPAEPADAALSASPRRRCAARPLMPSRSRSNGSSSASSVSSGIASTNPAPNSGIGMRRAITLTSGGITAWQRVVRDREHLEQRGEADDVKLAVGVAMPAAHLGHRRDAADHRHVVAGRAARAVEQRAEAVARLFDLHEVVEAEPKLLELPRRDARQRIAGPGRQLPGDPERASGRAASRRRSEQTLAFISRSAWRASRCGRRRTGASIR